MHAHNQQDVSQETNTLTGEALQFLAAWKLGVEMLGDNQFTILVPHAKDAQHWCQLPPRLDVMRKHITNKPSGVAGLMGVMASAYNPAEGMKLIIKAGLTVGSMFTDMTPCQRRIATRLLENQQRWQS